MSPFIEYLVKLSVSLAAVSLFYQLVLRRLTFYNWNRWYFILYTCLSFVIPFIDISQSAPQITSGISETIIAKVPSIRQITSPAVLETQLDTQKNSFDYEAIGLIMIVLGAFIMAIRFAFHVFFYFKIRQNAKLVSDEEVKIYHLEKDVNPFSFGNSIFFNPKLHAPEDLEDIILHEYVHVRQKHSADIIWSELLCIVNWFNPFAWLIRYAIRQNLEFIADRKVLENNVDPRQYQYLLLKVAGVPAYRIANQFSFSSLKQRIIMMNKKKTPQLLLSLFIFSIPVIALLLAVFRNDIREFLEQNPMVSEINATTDPQKKIVYVAGLILDAETNKPVAGLHLKLTYNDIYLKTITTNAKGFYFQKMIVPKDEKFLPIEKPDPSAKNGKSVKYLLQSINTYYEGDKFANFAMGDNHQFDEGKRGSFPVIFVVRHPDRNYRMNFYGVNKVEFFKSFKGNDISNGIFESLIKASPVFIAENNLKQNFRKAYRFPKNVITKYKNGYFNRERELMGYENAIQLYLNGKKASYLEVNEAFKDYPYLLNSTNEFKTWGEDGLYKQIAYLTIPLYKDAAPGYLVHGNMEWKNVSDFNPAELQKTPFFLDGFRQIYGTGSNMIPEKGEIRRVALFKGKLARYYDPNSDKVWWIETRPEPEVFERPDLAIAK